MPGAANIGANNSEFSRSSLGFISRTILTADQIRNLNTTPIQIAPAPVTQGIIIPRWIAMSFDAGSVVYVDSTGSLPSVCDFSIYIDPDNALYVVNEIGNTGGVSVSNAPSCAIIGESTNQVGLLVFMVYNGSSSGAFYTAASKILNLPLMLTANANFNGGKPTSTILHAAGSGYATGDTVASADGFVLATVNTVNGSGAVLTYTVTSSNNLQGAPGTVIAMSSNVAPQAGIGTGFQISVASNIPGNGTLTVEVSYAIIGG